MKMMNDLCDSIEQPEYIFGRPSLPLRDMIFASALKVYTTFSLRRFVSDMKTAQEKGFILKTPHYSRVARYMESEEMTPILENLIEVSSLPLKSVESDFAVDSSGFSSSMFSRWFDTKYGKSKEKRDWFKAHIMVGTKTNVITAVRLTEAYGHDSPQFQELVKDTAENFDVKEIVADKAYSSKDNFKLIEEIGAEGFIPFKKNVNGKHGKSKLWKKMYHYFAFNQEEFLQHYHKRSNIESTFSMLKRKFGANIRNKTKTAQINEVLLKILCHNVCVVIQEMNELGLTPNFKPQAT